MACIVGVCLITSQVLLQSFLQLEARESATNVRRVTDTLAQRVTQLNENCRDWAQWDETYNFVQGKNPTYGKNTLTYIALNLDVMVFLDDAGKIFDYRRVKRGNGAPPADPESLRKALGFERTIPTQDFRGLIMHQGRPMLVAVRPILPNDGKGGSKGWLLFGEYLGDVEHRALASQTHLMIEAFPLTPSQVLEPDCKAALAAFKRGHENYTEAGDEDTISGYGVVTDLNGTPVVLFRILQPRTLYAQGVRSFRLLLALIITSMILCSTVLLGLWERTVLSRLTGLSDQLEHVGNGSQPSVSVKGGDEISDLASSFNGLLGKLGIAREQLAAQNDHLERTIADLKTNNSILEHALDGIATFSLDGTVVAANPAFASSIGYQPSEVNGLRWREFIHGDDADKFEANLSLAQSMGRAETELRFRSRSGSPVYQQVVVVATLGNATESAVTYIFTKDISERKRLETQIEHQAFHDALTGLPNRALFMNRLGIAHARAVRHRDALALIFIDLDDFKQINDSFGHQAGDRFLLGVAERIQTCLRPEDTLSRFAGDEFTILLEGIPSAEEAARVADRIRESLTKPIIIPEGEAFACASMGIAFAPAATLSVDRLLRNADTAMYRAKGSGKGIHVVYSDDMDGADSDRANLEAELRIALDNGELFLDYQPIVNLRTREIQGVEALVRWNHPTRGTVAPNLFLPTADESNLGVPLGTWVLREACRQTKAWNDRLPSPLHISVNISSKHLESPHFIADVKKALKQTKLPPQLLRLEVAESVLNNLPDEARATLAAIRQLGIEIAVDDLGTAFIDRSTPVDVITDTVKIDRTFISKLGKDDHCTNLVGTMISRARAMGVEVLAEGVQTDEQVAILLDLGCVLAQGYGLFHPLGVQDFEEKLLPVLAHRGEAA